MKENGENPITGVKWSKTSKAHSVTPFQKQPFADVLRSRCSQKLRNIQRKTPVLEYFFNKFAGLQVYNFTRRLQYRCFIVNIAKFLTKAFFIKHLRWLLLPFTATLPSYYWEKLLVILFILTHPSKWPNTCLNLKTDKVDQGVKSFLNWQ